MTGHWFCHQCDEVVYRFGHEAGRQICPLCRSANAEFIRDTVTPQQKTLNAELAALLFKDLKESVQ